MYGGYRPPSVTPNVGPSKTDDERVAREKASVDAFRDALRMGWFKNNADLMERFNMLLRTVKNKKQIHTHPHAEYGPGTTSKNDDQSVQPAGFPPIRFAAPTRALTFRPITS